MRQLWKDWKQVEIKLLNKSYKKNDHFYNDFLNDTIESKDDYFTDEAVYKKEAPDFPIYGEKKWRSQEAIILKGIRDSRQSLSIE